MTKPLAKNKVLELSISVGSKKFYLTLEEAQTLQKILNDTLVQKPVISIASWPYPYGITYTNADSKNFTPTMLKTTTPEITWASSANVDTGVLTSGVVSDGVQS